MKKKIVWLVVSCLMVLALVLASCAPAVVEEEVAPPVEEEEVVEEVVAPGPEEPRYGGTITFVFFSPTPTEIFDPVYSTRSVTTAVHTYSRLGTADWSRGPQGTNEFPFSSSYIPDEYLMGDVVESWEIVDLMTIIFKLRQGVYWHNVPPMNGRAFTVEDVEYSFDRGSNDPRNVYYTAEERDPELPPFFVKIDDSTFQLTYDEEDTRMLHGVMNWMYMQPREMVEEYGDLSDWKHQCGTGPFMLIDCVAASSVTWERNPNYFQMDPFHPENRLPYIDKLKGIVIVDESTRLAALRTHKIDQLDVSWDKVEGLKKTNPELLMRQVLPDASHVMFTRTDIEPFSDVKVRQALSLALDQPKITEEHYMGNAYILLWPVMPSFVTHYTPLEELPDNLRELYEYHPDKARALLAEAGYPDGFKTEVTVPSNAPRWIDVLSIAKEYFADIGVDMEINVMEPSTWGSVLYAKNFAGMTYLAWGNNGIDDAFGWAHGGWVSDEGVPSVYNFGNVVDPIAQEAYETLVVTTDSDERERMRKEENLHEIEMCWEIPFPTPAAFSFWMPWIKGYAGEVGVGPDPYENSGVFRYIWIDPDLKYEITGIRE